MMEKVAVAASRTIPNNDTTVCLTRYGNVMASRGSVIPLFFQLQQKNPVEMEAAADSPWIRCIYVA